MKTAGILVPGATPHHVDRLDYLRRSAHEHGLGSLWRVFESKTSNLFVDDESESNVGIVAMEEDHVRWVSTADEISAIVAKGQSTLLILTRYNSWSSIDITLECFSMVCQVANVSPLFLHFVVGMGRKFSSMDEDFLSCYSTFAPGDEPPHDDTHWEICYNTRHFERHGRDLEDTWSCRQSAIHHSFCRASTQSTWVVIQPPGAFDATVYSTPHPMSLHLRFLYAGLANWREYLDSFAHKFKLLNQQIAIPSPYQKFKVDFSHEQQLHRLRGKLHHAQSILSNTKITLEGIAQHETALASRQSLGVLLHDDFQCRVKNLAREVDNYIATTHKLLATSEDLKSMISNILTFHSQELHLNNSFKLAQLAQADAAGSKEMAVLADLTFKDSRAMRIATAIAMIYLPINLVMSFFSSTLVWYGTAVEVAENHTSRMQIRREVWVASVAAVVLAITTMCWFWWWNWRERQRPDGKVPDDSVHP